MNLWAKVIICEAVGNSETLKKSPHFLLALECYISRLGPIMHVVASFEYLLRK